jgi:hypothetical protein
MWEPEFTIKEEIYQYREYEPKAVRVLLSLNMEKTELKMPRLVPVSWVRDYGTGRLFYTNLGHNESTWKDERFRKHILEGVKWAAKLTEGPAEPNPALQAELAKQSRAAAFVAHLQKLADLSGKDAAALQAAWKKVVGEDEAKADKLFGPIEGLSRIKDNDKAKEADMRKAAAIKIADELLEAK